MMRSKSSYCKKAKQLERERNRRAAGDRLTYLGLFGPYANFALVGDRNSARLSRHDEN